ncbi:MAG: hypothetical protein ABIH00_00355 [Armatimonadota bacterium]
MSIRKIYNLKYTDILKSPKDIAHIKALKKVHEDIKKLTESMKIKTMLSPGKAVKTNSDFIKQTIFPAFLKLYENWPAGYELLTRSKLYVKEVRHNSDIFNVYYKDKFINRTYAAIRTKNPDTVIININRYDRYNPKTSADSLYHELMHAIDQTAVKDEPGHIFYISRLADIKYKGDLTRIAQRYAGSREKAEKELYRRLYKKRVTFKQFYEVYRDCLMENNCWALKKPGEKEKYSDFFKRAFVIIDDKEELLVNGLELYFGSEEERKTLHKCEPELYRIIEDFVMPMVDIRLSEL